ncbi:MAG: alpha-glucan family phosphorylase [Candidatus Dormibacteraeota bacterium]|nr:alpha-glucan family phosphorylase [Candidatus Dormibacteraeota bacterium]MBV8446034.1 alpha-glucan family phosphorylase [Candidatus Dormibacteraeota bacterium]
MTETLAAPALDGASDLRVAMQDLAERLPEPLAPLAEIAYNYRWSWMPEGQGVFAAIDPERWEWINHNPIRLLQETSTAALRRAAANEPLLHRAQRVLEGIRADLARPALAGRATPHNPVAFLCAEFAVHRSLPIYAGGLGALAGDILKEASDLGLCMIGVGLFYRQGYFQQRMDRSGYQHEYWFPLDPDRVPAALVTNSSGEPVVVEVPLRGRGVLVQIWRIDVGRVPLYLLDAHRPENDPIDSWITSRLYVTDRPTRLAQYALLGIGSMRALEAMGIDPCVVHLNEGHAALAPLEIARRRMAQGADKQAAYADGRERTVFTTHTPVGAGNEGYDTSEIGAVLDDFPREIGLDFEQFLQLGRTHPDNPHEPFVMTPLGIKMSRAANGVSRRHGEVARQMWQPLFPERPVDTVPVGYVTNGVHVPTWISPRMRGLLDRYLGDDWLLQAADPETWKGVDDIPDEELWSVRNELRADFTSYARDRTIANRLARGDPDWYVEAAERGFRPDRLTIGFARRLAGYKRIYLLTLDPSRITTLLGNDSQPVQIVLAGKAHPNDEEGKRSAQGLFAFKDAPHVADRVTFLDNYSLATAGHMVSGCDVWVNLPRPPLEASGTSGMKAAVNGGLNLSVLDGWWAEAYDGSNGWALPGDVAYDHAVQDGRDAAALYDLVEHEVMPLFYQRDERGIPTAWLQRVRASLRTNGPRFSATRMMRNYIDNVYQLGVTI